MPCFQSPDVDVESPLIFFQNFDSIEPNSFTKGMLPCH